MSVSTTVPECSCQTEARGRLIEGLAGRGVSSPGTPSTLATHVTEIPVAVTINEVFVRDIRFPTSVTLDGSDALNTEHDCSAAYVILRTDAATSVGTRPHVHDRPRRSCASLRRLARRPRRGARSGSRDGAAADAGASLSGARA